MKTVDITIKTDIADFIVYTFMNEEQLDEFLKDTNSVLRKDSLCYRAFASAWSDGDVLVNGTHITGEETDSLIDYIYGGKVSHVEVAEL